SMVKRKDPEVGGSWARLINSLTPNKKPLPEDRGFWVILPAVGFKKHYHGPYQCPAQGLLVRSFWFWPQLSAGQAVDSRGYCPFSYLPHSLSRKSLQIRTAIHLLSPCTYRRSCSLPFWHRLSLPLPIS